MPEYVQVEYDPWEGTVNNQLAQHGWTVAPNGLAYQGAAPQAKLDEAYNTLYGLTGLPDLQAAHKAVQRGEYLNAAGQGMWGTAQLATLAAPAAKALPTAFRAIPSVLADTTGAVRNPLLSAADRLKNTLLPQEGTVAKPIKAYHGSPHDFDRFDLSKIGTGEGAQAYGHGLYVAENPEVASNYKEIHGSDWKYDYSGTDSALRKYLSVIVPNQKPDELLSHLKYMAKGEEANTDIPGLKSYNHLAKALEQDLDKVKHVPPGRMYEVNLHADPDTFLIWDKPLSEQPKTTQEAVAKAFGAGEYKPLDQSDIDKYAGARGDELVERLAQKIMTETEHDKTSGGHENARAAASEALRNAGISGIKYLDQGSRFNPAILPDNPLANEARRFLESANWDSPTALKAFNESNPIDNWGVNEREQIRKVIESAVKPVTHNYVVFDDKLIEIVKKYGLAPLIAGGALTLSDTPGNAQHLVPVDHDPFIEPPPAAGGTYTAPTQNPVQPAATIAPSDTPPASDYIEPPAKK